MQDVQSTTDELVSDAVISLAVNSVTYLYHEYVLSAPAFPSDQLAAVVLPPQSNLLSQKSILSRGGSVLSSRQSLLASQMSMPASLSPSRQQSLQPLPSRASAAPASTAADLAAAAAVQIEGQRTRLLSIMQLWAQCSKAYSGSRWQTSFARPVVILSLRALVEKLFTDAFPVWASSGQGADRLKSMDTQLLEWFDPHGFNSSISLLQSLHAAGQRSQDSTAVQRTMQHRRREFTGTTSLVATFFTEPKTAACRRLKSHPGAQIGDERNAGAELTQQQKGALFKSAESLLLRKY